MAKCKYCGNLYEPHGALCCDDCFTVFHDVVMFLGKRGNDARVATGEIVKKPECDKARQLAFIKSTIEWFSNATPEQTKLFNETLKRF